MADNKIDDLLFSLTQGWTPPDDVKESLKQIIESCLPEKLDPNEKHLFETPEGVVVDTKMTQYINGHNKAIDQMRDAINRKFSDE